MLTRSRKRARAAEPVSQHLGADVASMVHGYAKGFEGVHVSSQVLPLSTRFCPGASLLFGSHWKYDEPRWKDFDWGCVWRTLGRFVVVLHGDHTTVWEDSRTVAREFDSRGVMVGDAFLLKSGHTVLDRWGELVVWKHERANFSLPPPAVTSNDQYWMFKNRGVLRKVDLHFFEYSLCSVLGLTGVFNMVGDDWYHSSFDGANRVIGSAYKVAEIAPGYVAREGLDSTVNVETAQGPQVLHKATLLDPCPWIWWKNQLWRMNEDGELRLALPGFFPLQIEIKFLHDGRVAVVKHLHKTTRLQIYR